MTKYFKDLHFSLGLKISIGMITLTVTAIAVLSLYFYQSIGDTISKEKREKLTSDLKSIEVLVRSQMRSLEQLASNMSQKNELYEIVIQAKPEVLDEYLHAFAKDNRLEGVFITDVKGSVIAKYEKTRLINQPWLKTPTLAKTLEGDIISSYLETNQNLGLSTTVSLLSPQNEIIGTLSLIYLFAEKTDFVDLAFDITRSVVLVLSQNRIIASSHLSEDRIIRYNQFNQIDVQRISERFRFYQIVINDDLAYLAAGYPIQDLNEKPIGLVLAAQFESPYIFSERNAFIELLAIVLVYLLITVVTIHFIAKMIISKPLEKILGATNSIIQGDLSKKIIVKNQDELGVLATAFNNMTDSLSNIQNKLQEQSKIAAIGQTTSMLAHDIRRPFNNLRSFLEILPQHKEDAPFIEERSQNILQSMDSVSLMLDEMMEMSAPKKLNKSWVKIHLFIKTLVHDLFLNQRYCGLNVSVSIPGDLELLIDPQKMRRVFENILNNAVEAVHGNGEIKIVANATASKLNLIFKNNGPPIPLYPLENLFKPFVSEGKSRGTGLGMAIAKQFVEAHNALINASNTAEGPEFQIQFPLTTSKNFNSLKIEEQIKNTEAYQPVKTALKADSITPLPSELQQRPIELTNLRNILLVEDEQIQTEHIRNVIKELCPDCSIIECLDFDSAYNASLETLFDLVISDFDLGPQSKNGYEVLTSVRQILPDAIFLLTSHKSIELETLTNNPFFHFIPKPLSGEKIRNAIAM